MITERFGTGIPSNLDDAVGNWNYAFTFYFFKGNMVYKSTGDENFGSLESGYPKPIHDDPLFTLVPCGMKATMLAQNNGEVLYFNNTALFFQQNSALKNLGYTCRRLI